MCGITGIFAFNLVGKFNLVNIASATKALSKRGPDHQDIYHDNFVGLGHRRLSIIDTSVVAHQPMWDESKRYCIIFNGEIFNFQELKKELEGRGVTSFFSHSDTEVLLKLFIIDKEQCLNKLNGFFSFCIYDREEQSFFIARDRYGVKPLIYLFDEDKFIFASEMKSVLAYGVEKELDYTALHTYLQLNYIPAPRTIFKNIKKLMPGHYAKIQSRKLEVAKYYSIPLTANDEQATTKNYEQAKEKFKELLDASVQRRLISDVPLGAFLSGGIDSSVLIGLAAKHKPDLHTFSIGFKDEKFFDETDYARLVANHFKTEHTVFSLTNKDLFEHVNSILDYIDEPFADSSAINVYILSKETRKYATVALSGDGADELLGGYNKHGAFYRAIHAGAKESFVSSMLPLWKMMPKSRSGFVSNKTRQFQRFAEGMKLSSRERYWRWAGYATESKAFELFSEQSRANYDRQEFDSFKQDLLTTLPEKESINDILLTDFNVVLPNDMLMKVDLMSMANGLEVRSPFLDYELVNFAFSLPEEFKINPEIRKRIVQDAYKDFLPPKLYNRPKKGFEVPLLKWLRRDMKSLIKNDLLSENFVREQNIFNYKAVNRLKRKLFSLNPGDVHARIWALVVFQWWWKKYNSNKT
ncbi:MAG TPA: asparagine synthase (glutamine-hydrolyzing) [Cyclobacteriaceae bacterium]|jgi:asparagine synthase (glutamine-hydrolysing)|nr:asparagine synthase (glutamine-hydrolyzing) [Cyclobacteriaceae bacterium]